MNFRQALFSGLSGILFGLSTLVALSNSALASYGYDARSSPPVYRRQQPYFRPYTGPIQRRGLRWAHGRAGPLNYAMPAVQARRWMRKAQTAKRTRDVATQFRPDRRFSGEGYGKVVELTTRSDPAATLDVHAQFRPLEVRKKIYEPVQEALPQSYAPPMPVNPFPVAPYYRMPPMPYAPRW